MNGNLRRCGDGRGTSSMWARFCLVPSCKNSPYLDAIYHPLEKYHIHLYHFSGKTHYETLGVPRTATRQEIKEAFVNLSKKLHPDVNRVQASAKPFMEVNEAYRILINSETRAQYDLTLQAERATFGRKASFGGANIQPNFDPRQQFYTHNHKQSKHRQRYHHSRVVYALIGITMLATAIQLYRIQWYHRRFQVNSEEESRRNALIYAKVREEAMNSTLQEQLDAMIEKRARALENQRKTKGRNT